MYLGFYGLEREPFRLNPDPRFLHLASPHRSVLEAMLGGVSSSKGLQVSVGPIGTGKTTLLYCLQQILMHEATAERPVRTAFIVNPVLTSLEFFETLFDELEVPPPTAKTKPAYLRAVHEILCEGQAKNGILLLIIDEAHLLSPALLEEVRLLLNLDSYAVNVMQVLLCGQPELLTLLSRPEFAALKQRVSVFTRLRPLTLVEARAYIAERMHIGGLRGEVPFLTPALEEIHRRSNGVPRVINTLCDRALSIGYRCRMQKIGADVVSEAADDLSILAGPPVLAAMPAIANLSNG